MKSKLRIALLGLALIGLLLPATGCEPRRYLSDGSYADILFALDFLPGFGGVDFYDDGYYEDDYYGDFDDYYGDDYYEEEEYFFVGEYDDYAFKRKTGG